MATIVYLDADDEITSAASRIRAARDERVGLVLPFGSRVATSRINFRLLAREAMANGRRLDIVAPDTSARALAVSAGLPVFSSVGEYEAALDADDDATETQRTGDAMGPTAAGAAAAGAAAAGTIWAAGAVAGGAGPTGPGAAGGRPPGLTGATQPVPGDTQPVPGSAPIAGPAAGDYGPPGGAPAPDPGEPSVVKPWRDGPGRGVVLLVVGILAVIGVSAVAAYLLLPTADITVTPQIETIGPMSFTVTADPDATAVDSAAAVIPATTLEIPVVVQGEFPATGVRVVETKAKGRVRFQNCDPSQSYTIPNGTVVTTRGGIGFATAEQTLVPVATISGSPPSISVNCQSSEVAVTAVKKGVDGNVGAGQIRVVPARYNRNLLRVSNPAATSGGTREEFKQVVQKDVDAAIGQLQVDAEAMFQQEVDNPDRVPAGMTSFPETAQLGELTTDPADPQALVGQEVDTFPLAMSGSGTVQAVDETPLTAIAEERLQASISEGYQLVDGSTTIDVGDGTVLGGVITFDVHANAKQVRPLDANSLEQAVLGLSKADAEAALSEYGSVVVVLWPDWVGAVPTLDQRVTVTILDPVDPGAGDEPAPTPTARPRTPSPEPASPDGSAGDGDPSEPVPSG